MQPSYTLYYMFAFKSLQVHWIHAIDAICIRIISQSSESEMKKNISGPADAKSLARDTYNVINKGLANLMHEIL